MIEAPEDKYIKNRELDNVAENKAIIEEMQFKVSETPV